MAVTYLMPGLPGPMLPEVQGAAQGKTLETGQCWLLIDMQPGQSAWDCVCLELLQSPHWEVLFTSQGGV